MKFEKRVVHRLSGHDGAVLYCAVDPKKKILATCSVDGNIKLWTIATGEIVRTLKEGHTADVTSCAFSTIGTILASSSRDKKVILWHYETGKRASRLGKNYYLMMLFKHSFSSSTIVVKDKKYEATDISCHSFAKRKTCSQT